jgi:hypothetical protein
MLSMVQHILRWLEQAVVASRRREARRLLEHVEHRRREVVRRAAGRIGSY